MAVGLVDCTAHRLGERCVLPYLRLSRVPVLDLASVEGGRWQTADGTTGQDRRGGRDRCGQENGVGLCFLASSMRKWRKEWRESGGAVADLVLDGRGAQNDDAWKISTWSSTYAGLDIRDMRA